MSFRDAVAIMIVVTVWAALFVPLLVGGVHELQALKAGDKDGSGRQELKARLKARAGIIVPGYWLVAGVCTGLIANHPVPVGAGLLFLKVLFHLFCGVRWKNVGAFLLHVLGFAAGAMLGHWLQPALFR
jgi:hypothetical protein